jgi:hypothetical protein
VDFLMGAFGRFRLAELLADPHVMVGLLADHSEQCKQLHHDDRAALAHNLQAIERFDVNVAANWYFEDDSISGNPWSFGVPMRLPFPQAWGEFVRDDDKGIRFGCQFTEWNVVGMATFPLIRHDLMPLPGSGIRPIDPAKDATDDATDRPTETPLPDGAIGRMTEFPVPDGATHLIQAAPFVSRVKPDSMLIAVEMRMYVFVNEMGECLDAFCTSPTLDGCCVNYYDTAIVRPILFSLSLANVKGSRMSSPKASAMVFHRRRKDRRSPTQRLTYRVITVPGTPASGTYPRGSGGKQIPLHLVRGHFATYTDEAPLFGKRTGTYWRPAHTRGNPEKGLSTKDYCVKPQEGAPSGT